MVLGRARGPPCQVVEKLQYTYEELDEETSNENNSNSWFDITLHFPGMSYKEIIQVQAFDIESMVGNMGGYIGLFVGVSLSSLPAFIAILYGTMKKRGVSCMGKGNNDRKSSGYCNQETESIVDEMCILEKVN